MVHSFCSIISFAHKPVCCKQRGCSVVNGTDCGCAAAAAVVDWASRRAKQSPSEDGTTSHRVPQPSAAPHIQNGTRKQTPLKTCVRPWNRNKRDMNLHKLFGWNSVNLVTKRETHCWWVFFVISISLMLFAHKNRIATTNHYNSTVPAAGGLFFVGFKWALPHWVVVQPCAKVGIKNHLHCPSPKN